jgi:hypothetical protein
VFSAIGLPEAEGLGAVGHLAVEEGEQADAVQGASGQRIGSLHGGEEGGKDIDHASGYGADGWLADAGGPFDDAGNAQAAFPHVAFAAA